MTEVRDFIKGKAQKVVSTTESAYRKVEGYVDNKMQQVERNSLDRDLRNEKNNLIDRVSGILDRYKNMLNRFYREALYGKNPRSTTSDKMDVETFKAQESLKRDLNNTLKDCGYSNMDNFKQYLISNWHKLTKENIAQYLNNMKNPPFPYYYNAKKARTLSKEIDGFYTYEESVMKTLKTDKAWCENPLSDDMIVSKIKGLIGRIKNNYVKKAIEQSKDQEKKETENEIEKTMEELHKLIIEELNKCSNFNNFNIFLYVKLKGILKDNTNLYRNLKFQLEKYLKTQNIPLLGEVTNKWIDIKSGLEQIIDGAFKGNGEISSASIRIVKGAKAAIINKNKKTNGDTNEAGGEEGEAEGEEVDIESEENEINNIFEEIEIINYSNLSLGELRNEILNIFMDNGIDLKDDDIKSDIYARYGSMIEAESFDEDMLCGEPGIVMTYALACNIDDINNESDLRAFIQTVKSYGKSGKYAEKYRDFLAEMGQYYDNCIEEIAIQSLTARYEAAASVAEGRSFYESDFINFAISTNEDQPQSGLKVASNIDNVSDKLNHYEFKSNRTEHEEAALQYTAFDITFKNTFNLTNPIIEKLGAQQVDLRSDLFKYNIYNQNTNTFNQSARDKYVAEKLKPIGLVSEEIEELGNALAGLPAEVEKNYEILSGNFDTDQDNFEKIAKIYALGEIIDNIRNLFKNNEIFSDNAKLGDVMGFEFDESEPADIVGDCLLLKGKVNGTETKIKYDLRTGKLYMNAMTQQEFNPPKITIGNDEPNTEIGNLGNFDDLLEGYQPTLFTQADKVDYSKPSNENATVDENGGLNKEEVNGSENKDSNQKTLERLMENKLLEKLTIIGNTVREKAGEQSKENNVIDEFLRTFNILPDEGNSDTIEFLGGSKLYILLESIKNTNDENRLLEFSKLMNDLMNLCWITRGKNNLLPKDGESKSPSIFDIDKKDATTDIKNLQEAYDNFFSDKNGEKDRLKSCEAHFDQSAQLSFANIIVDKCCRRYGDGWKISTKLAEEFVNSVKEGIDDIKKDENDLIAIENTIDDDSMWA